jgi:predicted PurR-regulated permease PerM
MKVRVTISHKTIFFVAIFIALLWALYQIRGVIVLLFVSVIFMSALSPLIEKLVSKRVPKILAIVLIYLLIIGVIAGLITLIVTPLTEQTSSLIQNLPTTFSKMVPAQYVNPNLVQNQISNVSKNAVSVTLVVFNNLIATITVIVLSFYLLLERDHLNKLLSQFFIGHEARVKRITDQIEDKLGDWVRGQLLLSFLIGGTVFVMLSLIGVPYAIPLAILAAFMEVIPVIGPIISAIPGVLVALTVSPFIALVVGLLFIL